MQRAKEEKQLDQHGPRITLLDKHANGTLPGIIMEVDNPACLQRNMVIILLS